MNAGSESYHEEAVEDGDETVEMLQLFFRPRQDGLTPEVQFHQFENAIEENQWRLIAGYESINAPLKTIKIIDSCKSAELPEPEMKEQDGGFLLTIFKDILNEDYLVKLE